MHVLRFKDMGAKLVLLDYFMSVRLVCGVRGIFCFSEVPLKIQCIEAMP